jgi:hypothetical protein
MATKILIAIDDEGMLGGMSSEEIASVDVAASYQNYLDEISKRILERYPDAEIETSIGPTTYMTKVFSDDLDAEEDMTLDIEDIGASVYEAGNFWVNRNF